MVGWIGRGSSHSSAFKGLSNLSHPNGVGAASRPHTIGMII